LSCIVSINVFVFLGGGRRTLYRLFRILARFNKRSVVFKLRVISLFLLLLIIGSGVFLSISNEEFEDFLTGIWDASRSDDLTLLRVIFGTKNKMIYFKNK
jgi:hypothetical protein